MGAKAVSTVLGTPACPFVPPTPTRILPLAAALATLRKGGSSPFVAVVRDALPEVRPCVPPTTTTLRGYTLFSRPRRTLLLRLELVRDGLRLVILPYTAASFTAKSLTALTVFLMAVLRATFPQAVLVPQKTLLVLPEVDLAAALTGRAKRATALVEHKLRVEMAEQPIAKENRVAPTALRPASSRHNGLPRSRRFDRPIDTFVGTDTAYSETRPAITRTGDTRLEVGEPRGTPAQVRPTPRPMRSLRQTFRHIGVSSPVAALVYGVPLAVYLPTSAVVRVPLDSVGHTDEVNVALRAFEVREGAGPDVVQSPCRKVHALHIQPRPVGAPRQATKRDTPVHVVVRRAADATVGPYELAALQTL